MRQLHKINGILNDEIERSDWDNVQLPEASFTPDDLNSKIDQIDQLADLLIKDLASKDSNKALYPEQNDFSKQQLPLPKLHLMFSREFHLRWPFCESSLLIIRFL